MSLAQIRAVVREQDLINAERDHAQLFIAHAAGASIHGGRPGRRYFQDFAKTLRRVFAPADRSARELFAMLKSKARRRKARRASAKA